MAQKLRKLLALVRMGQFGRLWHVLQTHLHSDFIHVGLRRSTTEPFPTPRPRLSIELRPVEPGDLELFDPRTRSEQDADLVDAYDLLRSGMKGAYIAVTKDGEVCHLNFLIDASQNAVLESVYGDLVPPLRDDEGLLEAAYTLEQFRGRGVVLNVLPLLAERGRERGIEWLVAYPPVDNRRMIGAFEWAGFEPFIQRRDSYRLFRRKVRFEPLPDAAPA
jgi:RimJ/RimL family protein N-acetyltransferase